METVWLCVHNTHKTSVRRGRGQEEEPAGGGRASVRGAESECDALPDGAGAERVRDVLERGGR
eukprot:1888191-Rhodomonas_salina.1